MVNYYNILLTYVKYSLSFVFVNIIEMDWKQREKDKKKNDQKSFEKMRFSIVKHIQD